jgi:threonine dehydratase
LRTAILGLLEHEHVISEGAAAVGVAAILSGRVQLDARRVVIIVTGSNIDLDRLERLIISTAAPRSA